jgi:actin-related protein
VRRLDLAGRDLTEWMMRLLNEEQKARVFSSTKDREMAREVKEKAAYVALDFDRELEQFAEREEAGDAARLTDVKLPDGTTFAVGRAAFCCPELLFSPSIADKECRSVPQTVMDAAKVCPIDTRRTLLNNVVLSGGSTMFKNYDTRLRNELRALVPPRGQDDVRVIAPGERKYSVWMGAAILASLASFAGEWVTKQEYTEQGPRAVHARGQAPGSFVTK